MHMEGRRAAITLAAWTVFVVLPATPSVAQGLLPDIIEEISHIQIVNKQQQEILRFSTTHWNQGAGPLQIRDDRKH